jgi:tetratricopeptide (TPR) repeat protein
LQRAVELGKQVQDNETYAISLLLLGALFALSNRFKAAEERFAEVIELCTRTGDRFHLCGAYNNRSVLWMTTRAFSKLQFDLRQTIQLAREIGQPALERMGTHNLAEYQFWSGNWQDALELARRAYDLKRFVTEQVAADSLLLARILAACEQTDEAHAMVEEARTLADSGEPTHSDEIFIQAVELSLKDAWAEDSQAWEALLHKGQERLAVGTYLELVYMCAHTAARADQWSVVKAMMTEARVHLADCQIWEKPFAELAERI